MDPEYENLLSRGEVIEASSITNYLLIISIAAMNLGEVSELPTLKHIASAVAAGATFLAAVPFYSSLKRTPNPSMKAAEYISHISSLALAASYVLTSLREYIPFPQIEQKDLSSWLGLGGLAGTAVSRAKEKLNFISNFLGEE